MSKKNTKVVIIGNSAVGKTSLLSSYVDQKFTQSHKATIGADFLSKDIKVDGKIVMLDMWDTAGQDKFMSLGRSFYGGSDVCMLVYDITDLKSLQDIQQKWMPQFLEYSQARQPEKFPFVLVGNKSDRQNDRRVEQEIIDQFLSSHPNICHYTASAKKREGVETVFEKVALLSLENQSKQIFIPIDSHKLKPVVRNQKKKCQC